MSAPLNPTPAAAGRTGAPLTIRRRLAAPRALVFAAFTEAEHLRHWMGPQGMSVEHCSVDARPGGQFHYGLKMADGSLLWGKWVFREIVPNERIVVVSHFSDAAGGITRNPWSDDWPLATLSTTTFADDGGGTLLTLDWRPLEATAAEEAAFAAAHAGMNQGWEGTFQKLEGYLGLIHGS